ncbi:MULTISPECIES: mechanosensitive ion channel family protein [Anaerococcus]|uniref:Transporter, small conductance mechanosensitive ion channel MscS family protein n=1 Tax=Anaerococcus prevotii ACS-065-V-Col13 TaxID=879305 RepID=F0GVQ9_9FIRM|nr:MULTISPECIES: mechanosensitive ion channel family protein [Anaerococcus]EGC82081.1 transporter, small conductance mechanosensitive ion channel MscS family protein [Anaerococcus prevotii ACS-065-V-Col13]
MIEQIENQEMIRELMKNKLIYGAISIILVVLVSKIILNLLRKLIDKFLGGRVVKKSDVNKNKISTISKALYSVIRVVIIFIAITMILDIFGINTSTLIATAGVGGVAIALGTQTLIADFIKGIFIILDDKIRVGEWIMAAGVEGEVEALDFRVTKVRDFDGSLHIIPNSEITTVRNFNRGFMASEATFSVSYDTSLEEVKDMVAKVSNELSQMEEYKKVFKEKFEIFEIKDLNEFSYKVRIIARVRAGLQWEISRKARILIKKEMEERNIKSSLVEYGKNEEI